MTWCHALVLRQAQHEGCREFAQDLILSLSKDAVREPGRGSNN